MQNTDNERSSNKWDINYPASENRKKFIKILLSTPVTDGRTFIVNDEFFNMFPMTHTEVNQILNILNGKKLIHLRANPNRVIITHELFSYISDTREKDIQTKISLFFSIIALLKSFQSELIFLGNLITEKLLQLLKGL